MLQKELAERLTAAPGQKAYGRLSVALGLWFRMENVLAVPAEAFHPRHRVASAVLRFRPVPPEAEPPVSPEVLGRFTLAAFGSRRQTLLNNLSRAYGRQRAARVLADFGLDPGLRAETLAPSTLAALSIAMESG
jgi:16S rRNA (adenine1518-N6/adenine1519-N6)-dimethyltransferase